MLHYLILFVLFAGLGLIVYSVFILKDNNKNTNAYDFDAENIIKVIDKSVDDVDNAIEEFSSMSESVFGEINQKYQELLYLYSLIDEKYKQVEKSEIDIFVQDDPLEKPAAAVDSVEGNDTITAADILAQTDQNLTLQEDIAAELFGENISTEDKGFFESGWQTTVEEKEPSDSSGVSYTDSIPESSGSKYEDIYGLYSQGMDSDEIARFLGIGKGEVKLILELGKARS